MRFPLARAVPAALSIALLAAASGSARGEAPEGKTEEVKVATSRGVALEGTLHRPAKANGTAVVLAPGQGYHRGMPLMVRSAEGLASAGFTALRFDWAYWTAKGKASADLATEAEDLDAAVAHARGLDGVKRVILAGKSLGSLVALRRAAASKDASAYAGVALLTFPVHDPGSPARRRAGVDDLLALATPSLIVTGDRDPLCWLTSLYTLVSEAKHAPSIVVVPGDHGLAGPTPVEAETAENVDLAVRALVLWARRRVGA
jgi:predicted alpha/beta-hydrolase family hydrolase